MTPLLHGNQVLKEMWKYEPNSFICKVDIRKGILDQIELFVLGLYSNHVNHMIWLILKQLQYISKSLFKKVFRFKTVIIFLFAAETSAEFAETETGHTYHTSHYSAIWCSHYGHLALHNSFGDLAGKFSIIFWLRFQSTRFVLLRQSIES